MADSLLFLAALLSVIAQVCQPAYIDRHKDKVKEEVLQNLEEKWASKSVQETIKEGAFGLPQHRDRMAYFPKIDELDCSIRYLAYNYSKKLLKPSANFKAISDGLRLESLCGITPEIPEKKTYTEHEKAIHDIKSSKKFFEFFVDANHKSTSKTNLGSLSSPFRKVATAIHACQYKRNDIEIHCIIQLRGGIHFLEEPLFMYSKHSNILLTRYKNENAIISGGKVIHTSWKLHKLATDEFEGQNAIFEGIQPHQSAGSVVFMGIFNESNLCKVLCEQQTTCTAYTFFGKTAGEFANMCYAREDGLWNPVANSAAVSGKKVKIYVAELEGEAIKPFTQIFVNGKREIRARFPNGDPEKTGLHTVPTGYVSSALKWLPPKKSEPAREIHFKDPHREKTPFSTYYVGIGGPVSQYKPPVSYWGVASPAGGGGSTYKVPTGLQFSKDLEFVKRKWSNASTGVVHALQNSHWENWQFKLDARNDTDDTLRWSYGGFQGARGSIEGKEWYVENIFEELDVSGEWFLDETNMRLFYFPSGDPPSEIIVPILDNLVTVAGTQRDPVVGISILGLSFAHTTSTFLKGYQVPSGGDWSVHRNAMLAAQGTVNLTIGGCNLMSPGGNGIFIG